MSSAADELRELSERQEKLTALLERLQPALAADAGERRELPLPSGHDNPLPKAQDAAGPANDSGDDSRLLERLQDALERPLPTIGGSKGSDYASPLPAGSAELSTMTAGQADRPLPSAAPAEAFRLSEYNKPLPTRTNDGMPDSLGGVGSDSALGVLRDIALKLDELISLAKNRPSDSGAGGDDSGIARRGWMSDRTGGGSPNVNIRVE